MLNQRVGQRRRIFEKYRELLGDLPGIEFVSEAPYGTCTRWLTVILVDRGEFGATPEHIRLALEAANIESRPVRKPMHLQPVFKDCRVIGGVVSEEIFAKGLCLPSGTAMRDSDLERICGIIRGIGKTVSHPSTLLTIFDRAHPSTCSSRLCSIQAGSSTEALRF